MEIHMGELWVNRRRKLMADDRDDTGGWGGEKGMAEKIGGIKGEKAGNEWIEGGEGENECIRRRLAINM